MAKKTLIKIVRKFSALLKEAGIPVEHVILFGSYAKGEAGKDSDIDLCVVSKSFGKDRLKEIGILLKFAARVDGRIEAIPASIKAWRTDKLSPILHEVRRTGVKISI